MEQRRFKRYVPWVLLAAAAALVVALAWQKRSLEQRYARLLERSLNPHPGLFVPAFSAATVAGDSVRIGEPQPGTAQLLFFFTTTCPYCKASLPAWNRIVRATEGIHDVAAYGVALDSLHLTREYVRERAMTRPIVVLNDRRSTSLYRVRRVPLLLLVGEGGRVRFSRIGTLEDPAAVDSVLDAMAPVQSGVAGDTVFLSRPDVGLLPEASPASLSP